MAKKNLLFVVSKKEDAGSRLRIFPLYDEMVLRGWNCNILGVPKSLWGRIALFFAIAKSDVILLHKKLFNPFEVLVLKMFRKKIIYDFDDAIMFTEARRNLPMTDKFTGRFRKIIEIANIAVAGNEFLAREARKFCKQVEILTTPVDTEKYFPAKSTADKKGIVIGWIGMKGNLFYLQMLAPALKSLSRKFPDISLSIICSDFPEFDGVKVIHRKWSMEKELEQLHELDIGLMPLTDDIWSKGKCGFKILQYFSVGVPVVASPVGINSDIVNHGVNGFLASNNDEWESSLAVLIEDAALRARMGKEGRRTVEEYYSREKYIARYCSLITGLAEEI